MDRPSTTPQCHIYQMKFCYSPKSSFSRSLSTCGRFIFAPGLGGAQVQVESSSLVKNSGRSFLAILYGFGAFEAALNLAVLTLIFPTLVYCTLIGDNMHVYTVSN